MVSFSKLAFAALAVSSVVSADSMLRKKHHKKHHKKAAAKAIALHKQEPEAKKEEGKKEAKKDAAKPGEGKNLVEKIQKLEGELDQAKKTDDVAHPHTTVAMQGKIDVNGPLPADFDAIFAQAAAKADVHCSGVKIIEKNLVTSFLQSETKQSVIVEVKFEGTVPCVHAVQQQAAEATSAFVNGPMFDFLVAKTDAVEAAHKEPEEVGVNVDTEMPFGTLEPFGREDTAEELTEDSVHESDAMVDQMERAEVAEEKRSVFRALTRLRGAAITSFDGVARSQTGNIDEYNKIHKWRKTHPLHHLAAEESDTAKWAFPEKADF